MTDDTSDNYAQSDILDQTTAGKVAISASIIRIGAYGIGLLLGLVCVPLLVRHLGQIGFGQYFTVLSLVAIVSGLTEGGIGVLATRAYATRTGESRDWIMSNLFGLRLVLNVIGGIVAILFAVLVGYDRALLIGTVVVVIGMLIQVVQTMLVVPLQTNLRYGWVTVIDLARQIVSVGLILFFITIGAGMIPMLAVVIPAALVSLVLTVFLVRGRNPLWPRFNIRLWGSLVRDAGLVGVAVAVNTIYFRVTLVVMSLIASQIQTGLFSTAFQLVAVMAALPGLTILTVFPVLSRAAVNDAERLWSATKRIIELAAIIGSCLMVGLFAGSEVIVRFLGGASAADAAPVLQVLSISVFALFVTFACGATLLSLRLFRALVIVNVLSLTLSIALAVILIPSLGAVGAAIAASAAEVVLAVLCMGVLERANPSRRLPWGVFLVLTVICLVAIGIPRFLDLGGVMSTVVSLVVFVVGVAISGRFPPEVRHAVDVRALFGRDGSAARR